MPLGTPVSAGTPTGSYHGSVVHSTGIANQWQTIIDAGGMDDADNATLVNPTAQIVTSNRHILQINGRGSQVLLRVAYDDAATAAGTEPRIEVFGRSGGDAWQKLPNLNGNSQVTIDLAPATDVTDGTLNYTDITDDETFDLIGCDQFLVGVEIAIATTGADNALAFLQAKAI